jgi:REP element-mobilizing transposase RayT
MSYDSKIHHRQSVRLPDYDYSQCGAYYVTVCTQNRMCLFGNVVDGEMVLYDYGIVAQECWGQIPQHFNDARLHKFVVMPNHIHGIIEIASSADISPLPTTNISSTPVTATPPKTPKGTSRTIGSIVCGFKIGVTKRIGFSVWQRNYYEHIIRGNDEYTYITEYIKNNPSKWEEDKLWTK